MPTTEQMKKTTGQYATEGQSPQAAALRTPAPKPAGTRMGILQDWREGSTTGKERRRSQALRDGR
jgi:hypothetical protein